EFGDELFATSPLPFSEPALPAESQTLSSRDVALLAGVHPRASVLPRGESQLSGVGTLVGDSAPPAGAAAVSPNAWLLMSRLAGGLRLTAPRQAASTGEVAYQDDQGDEGQDRPVSPLLLAVFGGLALAGGATQLARTRTAAEKDPRRDEQ